MDPYITSHDPVWHRLLDGLVVFIIGITLGLLMTHFFLWPTLLMSLIPN
jgi:hypothetical protein